MTESCKIKGEFVSKSALTLLTKLGIMFAALVASLITARLLGPEGKGELAIILLAPSLLMYLGGIPISSSNVYVIGRGRYKLNEIFWNSTIFAFLIGLVTIAIFAIIFPWVKTFFQGADRTLLALAVLTVPFSLFYLYGVFIPLGQRKIVPFNILKASEPFAYLSGLIIFLLIFKFKVGGALAAYIGGVLAGCLFVLWYACRNFRIRFEFNRRLARESANYALKCHVEAAINFFNRNLAVLLINKFMTPAEVGYYVVALSISEAMRHLPQSISTVLFPEVSSKKSIGEQSTIASRVCRNTIFALLLGSILVGLLAFPVIRYLYGREFLPSVKAIWVLLPGIIFLSTYGVLSSYMRGTGRPLVPGYVAAVMLVLTVVLSLLLIPLHGIYGAALAVTITYACGCLIMFFFYVNISGEKLSDFLILKREDLAYYREFFTKLIIPRLKNIRRNKDD